VDERLFCRAAAEVFDGETPDVAAALRVATDLSRSGCRPGDGHTVDYVRVLATLGLLDATVVRAVEPHLDAQAILQQAGLGAVIPAIGADATSTWGVYAAHAPGHRLDARQGPDGWTLSGTKPWCSLAGQVSHAVITAEVGGREQRAFAVRLDSAHVTTVPARWVARGLTAIPSGPIELDHAPAIAVGEPGWYLDRPGFGWGAIGVAAAWYGIALALGAALTDYAATRTSDRILLAQLGNVDEMLFSAGSCLERAADMIDAGACPETTQLLAQRVRAVVVRCAEAVLQTVGHALGPGPLVSDESHARRVADLGVYLRQHHGERDLAYLGELVVTGTEPPRA
jgi:alkylation response protein AidB-like acyl-CoA dehydrogenase